MCPLRVMGTWEKEFPFTQSVNVNNFLNKPISNVTRGFSIVKSLKITKYTSYLYNWKVYKMYKHKTSLLPYES